MYVEDVLWNLVPTWFCLCNCGKVQYRASNAIGKDHYGTSTISTHAPKAVYNDVHYSVSESKVANKMCIKNPNAFTILTQTLSDHLTSQHYNQTSSYAELHQHHFIYHNTLLYTTVIHCESQDISL